MLSMPQPVIPDATADDTVDPSWDAEMAAAQEELEGFTYDDIFGAPQLLAEMPTFEDD